LPKVAYFKAIMQKIDFGCGWFPDHTGQLRLIALPQNS